MANLPILEAGGARTVLQGSRLLLVVYIVLAATAVFLFPENWQWDFRIYYYAGKVFAAGGNPYDADTLLSAARYPIFGPFIYPPVTLPVIQFLAALPLPIAATFYLVMKFAALAWLVILWRRLVPAPGYSIWFYLVCGFGFSTTILLDLVAGNIVLFEQVGLWLAFYFWWHKRYLPFCSLVIAVALFKLTPILFLGLLLFTPNRKTIAYLLASVALFLFLQLVATLQHPDWSRQFIELAAQIDERGTINPASLALLRDIGDVLLLSSGAVFALYCAWCGVVILVTLWALKQTPLKSHRLAGLFLFCLAYALTMPRFKDYSYVLLLLPTFYFVIQQGPRLRTLALVILIASGVVSLILPPMRFDYSSLLIALLVWIMTVISSVTGPPAVALSRQQAGKPYSSAGE